MKSINDITEWDKGAYEDLLPYREAIKEALIVPGRRLGIYTKGSGYLEGVVIEKLNNGFQMVVTRQGESHTALKRAFSVSYSWDAKDLNFREYSGNIIILNRTFTNHSVIIDVLNSPLFL